MDYASPISRLVAFFVAPICTALTAFLVNEAQVLANINLDPEQLFPLLTAASLGELAILFKWLDNRGKYERGADPNVHTQSLD